MHLAFTIQKLTRFKRKFQNNGKVALSEEVDFCA